METPKLLIILLCLAGAVMVGFIFQRGIKYKSWKLGFKEALSSLALLGGLLWVCFFVITFVIILPSFIDYLDTVPLSAEGQWLLGIIPYFCLITVWAVIVLVVSKVMFWKPKYTDKEKEVLKQERIWMRKHLGPLGKLVKEKEKSGSSSS